MIKFYIVKSESKSDSFKHNFDMKYSYKYAINQFTENGVLGYYSSCLVF